MMVTRRRLRRHHFRRHGLIRPTIGGLVLLAAGGASCFGGLLLDERTLMDVSIAIAVLFLCSVVMIVLQWFGVIAIGYPRYRRQIEQRDQSGRVVARIAGEPPADRRGRYVTVNTLVHWVAPLGLIAATRIMPMTNETLILPQVQAVADDADIVADARRAGTSQQEPSGGVRAYAPGDPLKLISWKHTARRGELMTRETGRDARPTLIVVLHTDVSAQQLDVQVASVLPIVRAAGKQRIIATDGIQSHEGIANVERFLAAACPVESAPSREAVVRRLAAQGPSLVIDAMEVQPLVVEFAPKKTIPNESFSSTRGGLPLLISFIVTLNALRGLIEPTGMWIWFAAAVFMVIAAGSTMQSAYLADHIHRPRWMIDTLRVAIFAIAEAMAVAVLSSIHLHDTLAQIWSKGALAANLADSWSSYIRAVGSGFNSLNLQLPPLKVVGHADLFLLILIAAAGLLIRFALIWRIARPVMATLPVAALAADYALAGHTAPLWAIGLVIASFPLLLWSTHPERTHPDAKLEASLRGRKDSVSRSILRLTPLLAAALTVAITLPLTAPAADLAYRVPLSIGEGGGMFTSNTVSPMIDLKRNIKAGSDTTVLTYQAYKRSYLRLTTLDNFDGDTWGYDREIAIDAGLYGSGIQLGRNSDDELTREQRLGMSPLSMYMYVLGYNGYIVSTVNQNTLEQFMVNANVRIDTLKSRFLPVPGMASYVEGAGSDWLMYQDGTVYNRTSGTSLDTKYMVYGVDIDPITGSNGFSKLSVITDAKNSLVGSQTSFSDEEKRAWYQARRNLADTGLASVQGDLVIINATIGSDGTVTGPSGWYLGKVSEGDGGEARTADGQYISMPGSIVFDATVVNQLGFGRDDYVIGVGAPNTLVLAMPMVNTVGVRTMDGSVSTFYGQDVWEQQAIETLEQTHSELSGFSVMPGSEGDVSNPFIELMKQYVERSDKRSHASRYTALPKQLPANIRSVVKQAQAAGISVTSSSYDDQVRAMRWLVEYFTNPENHFTYSLDAPDGDGRDNLDVINDFLDSKNGHSGYCQHYASALAVLGRALGVPTRIVLGYNAGVEPRSEDGFFTVQSKQLHAWVEAYLDGVGWVPFDVTPATTENGSASSDADTSANTADSSNDADAPEVTISPDPSSPESSEENSNTDTSQSSKTSGNASQQQATDAAANDSGNMWNTITDWFAAKVVWVRVLLLAAIVVALVGIGCAVPRWLRWVRRRRVRRIVARAQALPHDEELTGNAWVAVWRLIRREARRTVRRHARHGAISHNQELIMHPKPTDTDLDIAQAIAAEDPAHADLALAAARNATATAFGGRGEHIGLLKTAQIRAL